MRGQACSASGRRPRASCWAGRWRVFGCSPARVRPGVRSRPASPPSVVHLRVQRTIRSSENNQVPRCSDYLVSPSPYGRGGRPPGRAVAPVTPRRVSRNSSWSVCSELAEGQGKRGLLRLLLSSKRKRWPSGPSAAASSSVRRPDLTVTRVVQGPFPPAQPGGRPGCRPLLGRSEQVQSASRPPATEELDSGPQAQKALGLPGRRADNPLVLMWFSRCPRDVVHGPNPCSDLGPVTGCLGTVSPSTGLVGGHRALQRPSSGLRAAGQCRCAVSRGLAQRGRRAGPARKWGAESLRRGAGRADGVLSPWLSPLTGGRDCSRAPV